MLLCSGKMYYDLVEAREAKRRDTWLRPHRTAVSAAGRRLREVLMLYPDGTPVFWVQEEPENMGAWPFWRRILASGFWAGFPFQEISRGPSPPVPATGSAAAHKREQQVLLDRALGVTTTSH